MKRYDVSWHGEEVGIKGEESDSGEWVRYDDCADLLDNIFTQGTKGIVWGWVCIPTIEWESIWKDGTDDKN